MLDKVYWIVTIKTKDGSTIDIEVYTLGDHETKAREKALDRISETQLPCTIVKVVKLKTQPIQLQNAVYD